MKAPDGRVAALGGQQGSGVVDDAGHYPAAGNGSFSRPTRVSAARARRSDSAGIGPDSASCSATARSPSWTLAACSATRAIHCDSGTPACSAAARTLRSTSGGSVIDNLDMVTGAAYTAVI